MYYYFDQYSVMKQFLVDFNKDKLDNQPKAKLVAWSHTQVKQDREWIVFAPKTI